MNFPEPEDVQIRKDADKCLRFINACQQWISDHAEARRNTPDEINSEISFSLLLQQREAANVSIAASVPVSLVTFGASQAGKSLFIGGLLGKNKGGPAVLGLGDGDSTPKNLDFSADLNPRKGTEATAVITRFSVSTSSFIPKTAWAFPVNARLFSRSDLIKAYATGFSSECVQEHRAPRDLTDPSILKIAKLHPATAVDPEWRADIVDSLMYMHKEKDGRAHGDISPSEMSQFLLSHPLSAAGYSALAGQLFWEGWPELQSLFERLLKFKAEVLENKGEILLPWQAAPFILDSLAPDKIIFQGKNITWSSFGISRQYELLTLSETTAAVAKKCELRDLQALIAELQFPVIAEALSEYPKKLFSRGDVLDIPGARASAGSQGKTRAEVESSKDGEPYYILKRGKVSYLFDKYAIEYQAGALLYFQGMENLEAGARITRQIERWGQLRFGTGWPKMLEPKEQAAPSIFYCMTKLHNYFNGVQAQSETLKKLLKEEMFRHFGPWLDNYGGAHRPFQNVWLLRYPETIDRTELPEGIRNNWEQAFLGTDLVARHFANPADAWKTAFSQDGGLSKLIGALLPKLSQGERRDRLHSMIRGQYQKVRALMKTLYVNPDPILLEKEQREGLERIVKWLREDETGAAVQGVLEAMRCEGGLYETAIKQIEKVKRHGNLEQPDYKKAVSVVLGSWQTICMGKFHALLERFPSASVSAQDFGRFSAQISHYLGKADLAEEIASQLRCIDTSSGDRRSVMRHRYAEVIFDSFLITPGRIVPRCDSHATENQTPHAVFLNHWSDRLQERLFESTGHSFRTIPPGNDQLSALLSEQNWE